MKRELIKRVLADQMAELQNIGRSFLVERELAALAVKYLDEKIIKVITGVRRCGKSTFCHQLLSGRRYAFLNFDDERLVNLKSQDLDFILEVILEVFPEPEFMLFDEIQNVYGWELFINRLNRQGYNIVLTGSNSKMLGRELATHLTGRHVQLELFPFSFREYLKSKNIEYELHGLIPTKQVAVIKNQLEDYTMFGGFPEIRDPENKYRYLKDLYDKIVLRDIAERYNIREIAVLKEISILLANYYGTVFTFNKVSNILGLGSVNTTKEYTMYLQDSHLLAYLPRHSFKIKEEVRSPKKVYAIDSGMLNALSTSLSPDTGRKMENLVFLHEKRKGNKLSYFSDNSCEVDFVSVNNDREITLIQSAKSIDKMETYNRETEALRRAAPMLNAKRLILVTDSREEQVQAGEYNIEIIPLWKYLLFE